MKTDCGVGVAAVGNTSSDIVVMAGDRACKSGKSLS